MNKENQIDLYEAIWRCSFQIMVWKKGQRDNSFPIVFGCGFMLQDNKSYIFVTADHVVHHDDHKNGERSFIEYEYAIPTNINCKDKLSTILVTIPDFDTFEEYNFRGFIEGNEDLETAKIPDLKDLAFRRIRHFDYNFYTDNFLDCNRNIQVQKGLQKCCIHKELFAIPKTDESYIVMGPVQNKLEDGIRWTKKNLIHDNLHYTGTKDGLYIFNCDYSIAPDEWKGLSGSPFFSYEGELIGMLLRVDPLSDLVFVLPIDDIVKYINLSSLTDTNT